MQMDLPSPFPHRHQTKRQAFPCISAFCFSLHVFPEGITQFLNLSEVFRSRVLVSEDPRLRVSAQVSAPLSLGRRGRQRPPSYSSQLEVGTRRKIWINY